GNILPKNFCFSTYKGFFWLLVIELTLSGCLTAAGQRAWLMPWCDSLPRLQTSVAPQGSQHRCGVVKAMLQTQSPIDQPTDHLALQGGHRRGQYHRFLIARLERMATVQQRFFLVEALACRNWDRIGQKASRAVAVYHHPADALPGQHQLDHPDAHRGRQTPHGGAKI